MVHDFPQLPPSWQNVLDEILKDDYKRLIATVSDLYASETFFPPAHQLFRAFELCSFESLKVVILGQDPYHAAGQAHGLCFSVNEGVRLPPSLRNIYKEMQNDLKGYIPPAHGDLTHWATQGVLLLNSVLTVKEGIPGSHGKMGWTTFTDAVIKTISEKKEAVVFLLWGAYAIGKRSLIDEGRHLVLTAPHPSPLARGGFFGCRHFSKTNAWLRDKGLEEIRW